MKEWFELNESGEKHGKYKLYSIDGIEIKKGFYCNGEECGKWKEFYSYEEVQMEYNYNDQGKLHGDFLYYMPGVSIPYRKENYSNGEQSGIWIHYNRDSLLEGKLIILETKNY